MSVSDRTLREDVLTGQISSPRIENFVLLFDFTMKVFSIDCQAGVLAHLNDRISENLTGMSK